MDFIKKIKLNDNTNKVSKTDWIIIGIMVLLYGILSFIRLGDTSAPNTYKTFTHDGEQEIISLKEEYGLTKMRYFTGNNLGEIQIFSSIDGRNYEEQDTIIVNSVLTWQDISLHGRAKYIKFVATLGGSTLGDVIFYDEHGSLIKLDIDKSNPLLDEIDLVPDEISFMNSTYFDEIYYARTAYEYIHGMAAYEWTHPPLGKILITIPVKILGLSPFSYRLMANIFGILLIPIMYILAKKIFKNRKWALLAGLLVMFDTFHFVHTRIALVDGIQVTFILLSVLFMKNYIDLKKNDAFKKKVIYMLLSGFFIGCAIATKWNALYAGLGLAITFFVHLFKEYNVNIIKFFKKNVTINGILKWILILVIIPFTLYYLIFVIFGKNTSSIALIIYFFVVICFLLVLLGIFLSKDSYLCKTMLVCIVSFVITPVVIYVLSYVLVPNIEYYDGTVGGIIDITKMMYNYHSNLDATHPFSSAWYSWPIMYKPVWFYSGGTLSGLHMTISDIGNPAIWWCGIIGFIHLVINSIKKKEKNSIFILIFLLSTFIPYVFIGRLMFMYHYFITLPFVMFGIVSLIKWIVEKTKSNKVYYGYIALIIITFIVFYPIVSGMPVKGDYIESLKWLSSWYF